MSAASTLPLTSGHGVIMSTFAAATVTLAGVLLVACSHSEYAVRPVPRVAADAVGRPVQRLVDALGEPRKIDTGPTKLNYVWFLPEIPAGAPQGFHGCEIEVTVDPRSDHILGFTLANIGWGNCAEISRKVKTAEP